MSNEIFEISTVKQEFLQNMGPEYIKVFSEKQLEMSVYMLNEFCDALAGNNLVLLRIEPEPQQPAYRAPPIPPMGIPPQYQQQYQPQYVVPQDPFQEQMMRQAEQQQQQQQQQVQQQVRELNAQMPQRTPAPNNMRSPPQQSKEPMDLPPLQEVDLAAEKPKSFADKIREMRAGTKKPNRINPDDNEYA